MPRAKKQHRKDSRHQIIRVIGHNIDGTPIRKSFYGKNEVEALERFHKFKLGIEEKEQQKKNMPFQIWAEKWLYTYKEPDVRESTFLSTYKRTCENHILPYFKGEILQNITQADIKTFLNTTNKYSQSLNEKIMLCLNGIFETAIDNDLIIKNPCRNLKAKSKKEKIKKRTYDKESVEVLCSLNCKNSLMVHILLRMGLRPSELCGLKKSCIDFENKIMHIKEAVTTESGRIYIDKTKSTNSTRKIPIPEDLITRLKKELSNDEYIFSKNNKPITPGIVYCRLEAFYLDAKIKKEQQLSPHELRHTCGTLLYKETKDIYHVSRFLGHSDISITTKIYVHSEMQDEEIHIDFDF